MLILKENRWNNNHWRIQGAPARFIIFFPLTVITMRQSNSKSRTTGRHSKVIESSSNSLFSKNLSKKCSLRRFIWLGLFVLTLTSCTVHYLIFGTFSFYYFVFPYAFNSDQNMVEEGKSLLRLAKEQIKDFEMSANHIGNYGFNVFYKEATYAKSTGKPIKGSLLLLHGSANNMDGTADVWLQRDTMLIFAASGYRVVAPDLPGNPTSRTSTAQLEDEKKADFVHELVEKLNLTRLTVFGASWGASFSLAHLIAYQNDLVSSVQVCPVVPESFGKESILLKIEKPTLVIHGANDYHLGHRSYMKLSKIRDLRHVVIANASHAVFQQQPDDFHSASLAFLSLFYQ